MSRESVKRDADSSAKAQLTGAWMIMLLSWLVLALFLGWILIPHQYEQVRQYSFEEPYAEHKIDGFSPKYRAMIYANRSKIAAEGYKKYQLLRLALEAEPSHQEIYVALDMLVRATPVEFEIAEYFERIQQIEGVRRQVLVRIAAKRYQRLDGSQQQLFLSKLAAEFKDEVLDSSKIVEEIKFRS